ncbi:hypothetical protein CQ018_08760 [Arthrobacter sp. MYb227]|uniref:hypothetical protein n=1 Tax=Arthrobacter sp. MYb227 TaxID=1848601 RepID=UPI000CFD8C90|nr:hypothetical protein [Arthrobacter sp. MYb227]PQZ93735.1 hypothetical protein CQ018_08760 [Arthrobacter sp. MYb227]
MTGRTDSPLERLAELLADASSLGTAPTTGTDALNAVEIGNHLEQAARAHLEESVAVARARGVSWQDIGDAFGITRQAAFKRFETISAATPREGTMGNPIIDLVSRTEEVFGHLSKGEYGSVKSLMTFTCTRALTKKKLMGVWDQIVVGSGRFGSCSNTTIQTADGTNVLAQKLNQFLAGGLTGQTQLNHESGEWIGRVAYNGAGKITGILIVHPLQTDNLPF